MELIKSSYTVITVLNIYVSISSLLIGLSMYDVKPRVVLIRLDQLLNGFFIYNIASIAYIFDFFVNYRLGLFVRLNF